MPRTRHGFRTQVFERYQRRQTELDEAIGGMFVHGIDTTGKRELLAFTIGERENQQAWEDLLGDLKQRGVQKVDLSS